MICTDMENGKKCFAFRSNGTCNALQRPCCDKTGKCKFYKYREIRREELREEAREHDVDFHEYLKELKDAMIIPRNF